MKIICRNKKAFKDYEIFEKYEAGIVLFGNEVKSIKNGKISIQESYAGVENGEVFIYNMDIAPYEKEIYHTDRKRKRKLLLKRNEIKRIIGKITLRGFTMIPLSVFINDRNLIKVEIAIARGKKEFEKREEIKKKDIEMEMKR